MAKIKHTKNELKAQRDAVRRFERYLPTLQLKKQQLQMEVRQLEARIEQKESEEQLARRDLAAWVRLFADPFGRAQGGPVDFPAYLRVAEVRRTTGNIAGVVVPVFQEIVFQRAVPDLFATPSWVDDGIRMLEQLVRLRIERRILDEQKRLLAEELRVTSQRVNLFEKVKIPECRENIRVIRIFLGDQQTADVARAKIAKGRSVEKVRSA
jgi:V/A-type H+/Na+-transporting ATPase subunit D